MKITYINHSGFLMEWEDCYWLFDYFQGTIPTLDPKKKLLVFSSHSHEDHFNPEVFELIKKYPRTEYIFSKDNRSKYRLLQKKLPMQKLPEVVFLQSAMDFTFEDGAGDTIRIHTLISTDCGCAFVLRYKGKTIFHAGDLHWWTWPGESEEENRNMAGRYRKEISYLEEMPVDVVFTPLDPRQENDYALGMNYLLKKVRIMHLFPMHFWNDFSIMERYRAENQIPEQTEFHQIFRDGQTWQI